jgi:hypothetical protein
LGENSGEDKHEETVQIEEKEPDIVKPEWKKLLESSRKGDDGKQKNKSVLANMKKKITKPISSSTK